MNKVKSINSDSITFDNGAILSSDHDASCCEHHYLSFEDINLEDFKDLEFDLSSDGFFRKIPDYGIELVPVSGHSVKIPGYGFNNGYYGTDLTLCLYIDGVSRRYDITECQVISD